MSWPQFLSNFFAMIVRRDSNLPGLFNSWTPWQRVVSLFTVMKTESNFNSLSTYYILVVCGARFLQVRAMSMSCAVYTRAGSEEVELEICSLVYHGIPCWCISLSRLVYFQKWISGWNYVVRYMSRLSRLSQLRRLLLNLAQFFCLFLPDCGRLDRHN